MSELVERRTVIAQLRALGVKPSKHRGQNFLINHDVLAQIIAEVEHAAPQAIVEIGPGLGTVTRELAKLRARVIAIEVDHRLAARLQEEFAAVENVMIVEEDFLKLDLARLGPGAFSIVGNIPYRLTSPILAKLVAERERITEALLLTQAEVAEKIMHSPGPRGSALGVFINSYAAVEIIQSVPRTAFYPVPQVDSALWRMKFLAQPRFTADTTAFFTVVRTVYGKRRKMLRRALRDIVPADRAAEILVRAGIDPTRRGETLTIPELDRLAHAIVDQLPRE